MVQKEHSLIRKVFIFIYFVSLGCVQPVGNKTAIYFEKVDLSAIKNDTISIKSPRLTLRNGIYFLDNRPYSGFIKTKYENEALKNISSCLDGKQHGIAKSFFVNGKLETIRNYRNGLSYGLHYGYWSNGNKKFEFQYFNDKREGIQKQWYESGNQYYELTFSDDRENGMQQAWRENGKIYINYEVKDGIRYGLQKTALCYTLNNEKLK